MRVTDLLTASDVRAAGFQVMDTDVRDEPGRALSVRAVRGVETWEIGVGLHGESGVAAADDYFRDVLDGFAQGIPAERMDDLGDDAVYSDGWLYVRRRTWVFWVSVESRHRDDPRFVRDAARRLAIPVLSRVEALPASVPAGQRPPVVPRPRSDESAAALDPRPRRRALVRHWRALVPAGADHGADMVRRYEASGRAHDATELLEALRTAETVAEDVRDTDALLLAVWYHAAVLDGSGRPDPGASAELARDVLSRAGVRSTTVAEVVRLVAAGDRAADVSETGRLLALVLPCQSDTASTLAITAATLRPDTTAAGTYPRGHMEHVRISYEGGGFVAVDDRGREHRFARTGDEAPGSLGVVPRGGTVRQLVLLDRNGRVLARDDHAHLWPAADLEHFAKATGLTHLHGPTELRRRWGRRTVHLDTRRLRVWMVVALMVALAVMSISAAVLARFPVWFVVPLILAGLLASGMIIVDRAQNLVRKETGRAR